MKTEGPHYKGREITLQRAIRYGVLAAGICVLLGFIVGFLGYKSPRQGEYWLGDVGNWGSYLQGTTASFWSLGGLILIFVAFLAQQQQSARQSFENHFFQLLTLHHEIVSALHEPEGSAEGRNIFFNLLDRLRWLYEEAIHGRELSADTEALAVGCYEEYYDSKQAILGHYFRNLYHIIKFVHESGPIDKKRYTSIVRAQLSGLEQVFLHYNGLSSYGKKAFKPLIEDYALLENMNSEKLLNSDHPTAYSPRAFGDDAKFYKFLMPG
jgi:hypothetical protein